MPSQQNISCCDLHGAAEHIERETLNFGDTEIVAEERARDAKRPGGGHDGSLAEGEEHRRNERIERRGENPVLGGQCGCGHIG